MKEFFSRPEITTDIQNLIHKLDGLIAEPDRKKASFLKVLLKIIVGNPKLFDESCQVNIEWIGQNLLSNLAHAVYEELNAKVLDDLYGTFFRFVTEFNLSLQGEMSLELRRFIDYVDEEPSSFSESTIRQIQYARQQMPIAILKQLVGSPVLKNVTSPQRIADTIDEKFSAWNKDLEAREQTATRLKEALSKYTTAFNFVGLHQGFDQLSTAKGLEIKGLNRLLVGFGALAGAPLLAELLATAFYLGKVCTTHATA